MPTIFYSWQSDLPNAANRNLIRCALEDAVESLNHAEAADVEDGVRLDHGTQGAAGSPAIVDTILAKIEACDVFVPDVAFVAQNNGRRCPNPNVLIEYGYALGAAAPGKIVAVMNMHFEPVADVPFDMRRRRAIAKRSKAPSPIMVSAPNELRSCGDPFTHTKREEKSFDDGTAEVVSLPPPG